MRNIAAHKTQDMTNFSVYTYFFYFYYTGKIGVRV